MLCHILIKKKKKKQQQQQKSHIMRKAQIRKLRFTKVLDLQNYPVRKWRNQDLNPGFSFQTHPLTTHVLIILKVLASIKTIILKLIPYYSSSEARAYLFYSVKWIFPLKQSGEMSQWGKYKLYYKLYFVDQEQSSLLGHILTCVLPKFPRIYKRYVYIENPSLSVNEVTIGIWAF